ncbi:ADP-ribosylglycohydrolase family protein [Streptomyces sp. NPDC012450]|uniref:ADP-ribosylglycohydrolase family protein n=1 Tax=Streptomyces sp. NPDC012450 TaxID=3364834 RepID=UPI0036EFA3F6
MGGTALGAGAATAPAGSTALGVGIATTPAGGTAPGADIVTAPMGGTVLGAGVATTPVGSRPAGRGGASSGGGWAQAPVPGTDLLDAVHEDPAAPPVRDPHDRTPTPAAQVTEPAAQVSPRRDAIEGLLLGLAAGDAAGWPAARHRAARMPEWTRRLTRELDTFAEQNATTTLPVPIALNQPPEPLRLGPSDDAEWAAFTAEAILASTAPALAGLPPERRLRASVDLAWNALAGQVAAAADRAPEVESAVLPLRARISVRAGLGNLATGLRPPATGHDNPHYFDDAACVRAAVLALVHPGDPRAAAELAEFDARYTQDGDGVHGARATAAAVAAALGGATVDASVGAALAELPPATEIGRNARQAVELARSAGSAFALVPLLEHQIVDHVYSYGVAAAETVPVALALALAARGEMTAAVPAAACLSRVADSAPALAGALTGALGGGRSVPASWRAACRTLAGCALPRLAGTDLVELAGLLGATEPATPGGQFRHGTHTGRAHPGCTHTERAEHADRIDRIDRTGPSQPG